MSRSAPFVIVALVAVAALGGGAYLYRAKRAAASPLKISKEAGEQEAVSAHVLGPADAAVTLEEFGDFQCPPCGRLSEPINQLQKHYNIRIIYRNFPLPVHEHATEAAYAAEAAGRQGRFWQMHDLLFREQAVWSKSPDARSLFNAYAGMLQLDSGRFKQDMDSSEVQRQVDIDKQRGAQIGVSNTPTIFLNNQAVPPTQLNPESLAAAVEAAMKSDKPSS
ncbi:MAG: thioredoxin domain-containing protein [Verrucomicrobia bacterium]|nr:thioredoxin domain-containing protein [Verrucomicrobiota bacterium]